MTVGRICVRSVDVANATESIQIVARRMSDRNVGTLVVVDSAKIPVGMVTDRDLVVRILAAGIDPAVTTVGDAMTRVVDVVLENTTLEDALRIMRAGPYRRIPVVDSAGVLIGLLSLDDILRLLAEEFSSIGALLQKESPSNLASS